MKAVLGWDWVEEEERKVVYQARGAEEEREGVPAKEVEKERWRRPCERVRVGNQRGKRGTHPFENSDDIVHAGVLEFLTEAFELRCFRVLGPKVGGGRVGGGGEILGVGEEEEGELSDERGRFGETVRTEDSQRRRTCCERGRSARPPYKKPHSSARRKLTSLPHNSSTFLHELCNLSHSQPSLPHLPRLGPNVLHLALLAISLVHLDPRAAVRALSTRATVDAELGGAVDEEGRRGELEVEEGGGRCESGRDWRGSL